MNNITQLLARLHNAVNENDPASVSACYGDNAKVVSTPLKGTALVIAKLYLVPKAAPHALPCDGKRAVYVMQRNDSGEWRCIIDNFFGTDLLDFA